ncbi:MAG: LytR C-terminal domain-containing protein [Nocardioides sp.]|uniref:LytR C-terminal domain-containing protein n=1 Tax=Nocardioides sp. TaxID=35761 RepID=UPI003EFC55C2
MSPGARSALTLGVLGLLVVVAAVWGWQAMTTPFPGSDDLPVCVDKEISVGDEVFRDQVVVSVFNGSGRNGLAGLTQESLVERGFGKGSTGNAERTKVTIVRYTVKNDPAALLVGKQFGKVKYVKEEGIGDGVTVIVGERYKALAAKAPESVTSKVDTTICAVPGTE